MEQLAKIIADSQAPAGARLTTMEIVIPRIVLAEFNTHRVFSRNSASSRAIPVEKMLQRVKDDPYIPEIWTTNQKGMQGKVITDPEHIEEATQEWLIARDYVVRSAERMMEIGIHKQTTNRLLEPFMWHTVIVTATEWSNFFNLRTHTDAHPAIQNTARAMLKIYEESTPMKLDWNDWHLPFIRSDDWVDLLNLGIMGPEDDPNLFANKVSSARCARVSYLTHDGIRDLSKDIELHDRLLSAGHMSPFEHPAQAMYRNGQNRYPSNFAYPWVQYRKTIPNEADIHQDRDD